MSGTHIANIMGRIGAIRVPFMCGGAGSFWLKRGDPRQDELAFCKKSVFEREFIFEIVYSNSREPRIRSERPNPVFSVA